MTLDNYRKSSRRKQMTEGYPTLSLKERDRRWMRTREMMRDKGLELLLVAGLKGRERYEGYLTNEYLEGIVVFPQEGEPVYLTWGGHRITRRLESTMEEQIFWVDDIRVGISGPCLVAILREKGLDQAKIGVVGLESQGAGETEGIIPYKTWAYVLENLPKATFRDISRSFSELMLVKSKEELALAQRSADIGELACEAMIEVTKAGTRESEIYAAVISVIYGHGAFPPSPRLLLTTGQDNVSWGPPIWTYGAISPRVVQNGDVVQAEIFSCYGGIETQQQMAVAVMPVSSLNRECADVARRSYEAGLKALCPGRTFREVVEAMEMPLAEAGCWHLTPLVHSLAPLVWVGPAFVRIDQLPGIHKYPSVKPMMPWGDELIIKANMLFELEPNACKGKHRVNIGGTVVVTEDGAKELNKLPTEMWVIG